VAKLTAILEQHGIPFWYSRKHLMGAQQWHDEIGAALQRCDWFLVVLSPEAVKSRWVKRELLFALQEARYDQRILPILHKSCSFANLSWTLGGFHHIDFSKNFETGCRELLRTWGVGYQAKSPRLRKKPQ
jgi:hypothetical protein